MGFTFTSSNLSSPCRSSSGLATHITTYLNLKMTQSFLQRPFALHQLITQQRDQGRVVRLVSLARRRIRVSVPGALMPLVHLFRQASRILPISFGQVVFAPAEHVPRGCIDTGFGLRSDPFEKNKASSIRQSAR